MSNQYFPTWLPGLLFTQSKRPQWSTDIHEALVGKETRQQRRSSPLYKYVLAFEFLQDTNPRTNYLPYSNDLLQWSVTAGVSVLPNQVLAPDGTLTADLVLYSGLGLSGSYRFYRSGPITLGSSFVDLPCVTSLWLRVPSGTLALTLSDNTATGSIVCNVTTTWQRFSYSSATGYSSANPGSFMQIVLYSTGLVPFMVYAWGAQAELGMTPTALIPTQATAITAWDLRSLVGFFNSVQGSFDTWLYTDPSFNTVNLMNFGVGYGAGLQSFQLAANQSSDGVSGALEAIQNPIGAPLIYANRYAVQERLSPVARTNLILQSQALATTWNAAGVTPTNNISIAPDGTTTGTRLLEQTANSGHYLAQNGTVPAAAEDITATAYFLPNLTRTVGLLELQETTGGGQCYGVFNLTGSGSVASIYTGGNWANVRASISLATNGYYRCVVTGTKTNAATTVTTVVQVAQDASTFSYVGIVTNGLTVWGVQTEVGSFSTYYLPTTTVPVTQTDYVLGSTGIMSSQVAGLPGIGIQLYWTGSFAYRCRFQNDELDFMQFAKQMWETKKVEFRSVTL